MKKTKIALLSMALIGMLAPLLITNGLSLHLPKLGDKYRDDAAIKTYQTQIDGSYSVLGLIGFINSYLWFAIGFVCFLFAVINGYKLITAQGDEKQTKEATKALIGCAIGIGICLLAYIIVNVTLRLFA